MDLFQRCIDFTRADEVKALGGEMRIASLWSIDNN